MAEKEQLIREISELTSQLKRATAAARLLKTKCRLGAVIDQLPQCVADDAGIRGAISQSLDGYINQLESELKAVIEAL